MAPSKSRTANQGRAKKDGFFNGFYKKYVNLEFVWSLVVDPSKLPIVSVAIILAELVLNVIVINRVPYTEIDWKAYMQECEGFLNGTTNYALLRGDTGPLVYPAGFLYIYSALYYITSSGQNIRLAQYIFALVYLLQMFLVLRLYTKSRKVPPYVLVLCAFTSYRIHSIYVLRLFNDPIAVLFLYIALNLFLDQRWTLGSIFFSLGVSVKMNILLFAPAVLLLYVTNLGYNETVKQLFVCGFLQLVLGSPFLFTHPLQYIKGSFDLGRVFEHKWTVNYRFLHRSMFESKFFHINLLLLHLALLALFAAPSFKFFQSYCRLRTLQKQLQPQIDRENARVKQAKKSKKKPQANGEPEKLTKEQEQFLKSFEKTLQKTSSLNRPPKEISKQEIAQEESEKEPEKYAIYFDKAVQLALLPLFLCNFVGIVCARSLHYQFYVWYFHTLPYLAWSTDFGVPVRFLLLGLIEFCWNTYPSTNLSSLLLHCCHLVLLIGVGRKLFKTKTDSEKIK